jgi:hypothetical protein
MFSHGRVPCVAMWNCCICCSQSQKMQRFVYLSSDGRPLGQSTEGCQAGTVQGVAGLPAKLCKVSLHARNEGRSDHGVVTSYSNAQLATGLRKPYNFDGASNMHVHMHQSVHSVHSIHSNWGRAAMRCSQPKEPAEVQDNSTDCIVAAFARLAGCVAGWSPA